MEQEIRRLLGNTAVMGRDILYFEELDSTNTYAKGLALTDMPEGTVVIADCQTAGRGRMNRSFQSPKGKGLYLTVLLRPQLPPEHLAQVTALAGIAVCGAVERVCGVRPGLKWPNDPVLNGKKICGILTELVTDGKGGLCLIVGIGINFRSAPESYPADVLERLTWIYDKEEPGISRNQLAAAVMDEMLRLADYLEDRSFLDYYREHAIMLDRDVRCIRGNETWEAHTVDIDRDGGLIIRLADGTLQTLSSGEISIRW